MPKIAFCKLWMVAGLLLGSSWAIGQAAQTYTSRLMAYQEGLEAFDEGRYAAAQRALQYFMEAEGDLGAAHPDLTTLLQDAELKYGQCAIRLEQENGELLILNFVREYAPSLSANVAMLELAHYYFDQRNYPKALAYYERVNPLSLENDDVIERSFKSGYAYFVQKQYKKSQGELAKIKEIQASPYYAAANYYYGITAFMDSDNTVALASFKRIEDTDDYRDVVPYYICQIYFAEKNYAELTRYGEIQLNRRTVNNKTELNQLVGQGYFEQENYDKALPFLEAFAESARRLRKEDLYQVAFTQYKTANYKKAIKNFEEIAQLKSAMGQNALYNLADCHLKTDNKLAAKLAFQSASLMDYDKDLQADAQFNYAKVSYELKDDRAAITALQAIPLTSKYYEEAQELLSALFLRTNNYAEAVKTLETIPNKSPKLREAYQKVTFNRGVQLYNDRKFKDARSMFARSLENAIDGKTNVLTYFWLGELDHLEKDYAGSVRNFDAYLAKADQYTLPREAAPYIANYAQGYNFLKQGNYSTAQRYFFRAIKDITDQRSQINDKLITEQLLADALLRNADCYLKRNKYSEALLNYEKVIASKYAGTDYALLQKGVILGLQQEPLKKILVFNSLTTDYPGSEYVDDALLELGKTYVNIEKPREAMTVLKKLVNQYQGKSDLINKALLQLGLIAYNLNEPEEALNYYKQVFANAPYSKEAKDALRGIEEIYIERNETDKYFAFLNSVPGYQVTGDARDSLTFRSAETQYSNGEYAKAITAYSNYINQFKNGRYIITAYYQRGESYFTLKRYAEALADYEEVVERGPSRFYQRALQKAAYIAAQFTEQYDKAYGLYAKLASLSSSEEDQYNSQLGAMRAAYKAGLKTETTQAADALLLSARATNNDQAEAYYYKAKVALQAKDLATANLNFERVKTLTNNAWAAEAHFQMAVILFEQKKYEASLEMTNTFNEKYGSYEYWFAKSVILSADNLNALGQPQSAISSLESVIQYYQGDQDVINEAKSKLAAIQAKQQSNSRISND